jgi:hypothetical protein
MERNLSERDFAFLFIDGKGFADDEMIIALGITIPGEKVILVFIQSVTENEMFVNFLMGNWSEDLTGKKGCCAS